MADRMNARKVAPEEEHPRKAFGLVAHDASGVISPFLFSRRNNGDNDVTIKIFYCGICHTDLHSLKNEWGNTIYPIVPGHEITGEVTEIGANVTNFKLGDKVGVGCLVDSCRTCQVCTVGFENYCPKTDVSLSSPLTSPPGPTKHCNAKLFKKSWYQRTIELIVLLWKPVTSRQVPASTQPLSSSKASGAPDQHCEKPKLRKCSSLKVATSSFTRVCLCAPISSYNELFQVDNMPPRRSYSYPRSKSYTQSDRDRDRAEKLSEGRASVSYNTQNHQRKIFRGKSLSDDVLMRRFVIEEATVLQAQKRRTNQMEFIRKRNAVRRKKLGPSPLGQISITEEEL